MQYLDRFWLPSEEQEAGFLLSFPKELEMQCYSHDNVYPFKLFPPKQVPTLCFSPVTVFYGGNGSGKSTLLNLIAAKLDIEHTAPFNNTPFMSAYLERCRAELTHGDRVPRGSRIITSDDVFDFLLDIRSINEGVDRRREELFAEYDSLRDPDNSAILRSLEDYADFKRHTEAKRKTKSIYTARRLPRELSGRSNGESAFAYFTGEIRENALYLLDEPENSLSAKLQLELARFIEDSARFYGCQFVIATHSPFLLASKSAVIYDLDAVPVASKPWTALENIRIYHDFFVEREKEFES